MLPALAVAQSVTPDQEYAKFIGRARSVSPLTEFGDQINLRDGSLLMRATDIELRGTGPTIRLTRTYRPGGATSSLRETSGNKFDGWELEIPRIKTITANSSNVTAPSPRGWQVAGSTEAAKNQRCTNFAAPGRITFSNDSARSWNPSEWWDGYYLVDDSGNSQPLMTRYQATVHPDSTDYKLMTLGNWAVGCLAATTSGEPGEGFLAIAPDGTRYWFNHLVYRPADTLERPGDFVQRRYASMLVTRIEDRFGNWVTYSYSAGRLTSIDASDGRHVGVTFDGNGQIAAITAGSGPAARTWTYQYEAYTADAKALVVILPGTDGSRWRYELPALWASSLSVDSNLSSCTLTANDFELNADGNITSPAGAKLTLRLSRKRFGRSYVPKQCWGGLDAADTGYATYPREWYAWAVTKRTVTVLPGLPAKLEWRYNYQPPASSWASDCPSPTSCPSTTWTDVKTWTNGTDPETTNPDLTHRSIFSTKFDETENMLLREEQYSSTSQLLRSTDHAYATVASGAANPYPWPMPLGNDLQARQNPFTKGRWSPERQRVIGQQDRVFTRNVDSFNAYARPAAVTNSSTIGYSRTETIAYEDNTALWVLGQVKSVSAAGLVPTLNTYNSAAQLSSSTKFGIPQATYTWNPNGTLLTHADGAGNTTTYLDWYRGLPQQIVYADGATESVAVNDHGWITSHTDENTLTTGYAYDGMGRLKTITPPAPWNPTNLVFEPVSSAEYELPAGHWRQTVTTGYGTRVTYFDGLWRPVITREYDAADQGNTSSVVLRAFDGAGRQRFESYPVRSLAGGVLTAQPYGQATEYDALGRVTRTLADSEQGWLTTTYTYLSGFQTAVTNPRGYTTTTAYGAFDDPGQAFMTAASLPEGVNLAIGRSSVWGDPEGITRSGGGKSVTRSYVYDTSRRLCKTVEPESGATLMGYDAAGNVAWRAVGTSLTSLSCDRTSAPAARTIAFGHDSRNRLISTQYGDNSPSVNRTYTPDGLLASIGTTGGSNPITWTYGYNTLRKLTLERYTWGDPNNGWNFQWGFDANGHVASLTDPWGTISYGPNALGQATQVSGYASGITYHPSGAVASYALANGTAYSSTPNIRGLTETMRYGSVAWDHYSYDANGNVTAIEDETPGQSSANSRTMPVYDGLDRLRQAAGPWGNATYAYDALDNLVTSTVGSRSLSHDFLDGTNRLNRLTGSQSVTFGYDANGNVTQRGTQTFAFDIGNRMLSATGKANYLYDGHGRRNLVFFTGGDYMHQAYTQDGRLRFAWRQSDGGSRRYVYLSGKLIAETAQSGVTTYSHTDALGSPVAVTDSSGSVAYRTRYEPYGATVAGSTNPPRIGFTGHVNDPNTGLVYMQQRYYEPMASRFLSVDPVTTDVQTGKAFSRYHYASNNAYAFVDPDGRQFCGAYQCSVEGDAQYVADYIAQGQPTTNSVQFGKEIAQQWVDDKVEEYGYSLTAKLVGAFARALIAQVPHDATGAVLLAAGPLVRFGALGLAAKEASVVTKEVLGRKALGADGAKSAQIIERENGKMISRTHEVTKDGKVLHQHQNHTGKYGGERQFPDEWTGTKTINAPYENIPPSFPADRVPGGRTF